MIQQEFLQVFRAFVADLDTHGGAVAARLQLAFEYVDEVRDFLLVNVEIGIARDAELVATLGAQAGEQLGDMHANDGRQEHVVVLARIAQVLGQPDDARQRARRLHHAAVAPAPEGVAAVQAHDEVEALVEHARERP